MRTLDYGEHALLVEVPVPRDVPAVRDAAVGLADVVEAVAGAATVLVVCAAGRREQARAALEALPAGTGSTAQARSDVELAVTYDGPDLDDVARDTGLSVEEVVARHTAPSYVVRFCGFAPGFAYLDGLDERLHLPRRSEPRVRVPAGSVGIAAGFTGVYPRESPGGWRLLGRVDPSAGQAPLWDVERDPPALLTPGTGVRFVAS